MSSVPDFTEAEQWSVETTLKERWPQQRPEFQLTDVQTRMHPQDRELTVCPAMFREAGKSRFVITKAAAKPSRSQFYYRGYSSTAQRKETTMTIPTAWYPCCRFTQTRKPKTAKSQREQHTEFRQ